MLRKLISVGVLLSAISLIALPHFISAKWLVGEVQKRVDGLAVEWVKGSLWRGSVESLTLFKRGYLMPLGNVTWYIDWRSLQFFQPCIGFSATQKNTDQLNGYLCVNPLSETITLREVQGDIAATHIAELTGLAIDGVLQLQIDRVQLKQGKPQQLSGDVFWQQARFHNGERWLDLGQLLITLQGQDSQISAHWLDMPDAQGFSYIDVDIDMQLINGQLKHAQGSIKPLHTTDPSLEDTLELFSQYQENRVFFIDYKP